MASDVAEVKLGGRWFRVHRKGFWVKGLRATPRKGTKHWAMLWSEYSDKAPGPLASAAFAAAGVQPVRIDYDEAGRVQRIPA